MKGCKLCPVREIGGTSDVKENGKGKKKDGERERENEQQKVVDSHKR